MKNYFLILFVLIGLLAGCGKVGDCKEEKYASAVVSDFPDSLHKSAAYPLKVQYIIENSCGSFVGFEETKTGNTTDVRIKTIYDGCNCTLEFSQQESFYEIKQDSVGTYHYNFWLDETDFDSYTLTVH